MPNPDRPWEKPWYQMTADEREAIRIERQRDSGGAECAQCGREDYEDNLTEVDGKEYCDDCFADLMEPEAPSPQKSGAK